MTRFARVDKSVNKRKHEEASTWKELQEQMVKKPKGPAEENQSSEEEGSSNKKLDINCTESIKSPPIDKEPKVDKQTKTPIEETLTQSVNNTVKSKRVKKQQNDLKFQEDDTMTEYEGYWIRKESLAHLNYVYRMKFDRIKQTREDQDTESDLTDKERIVLNRLMKKEKRREHAILCSEMRWPTNYQQEYSTNNRYSGNAKFDGYNVREEGAERLNQLADTLRARGCSSDEISEALKQERRQEEKLFKKETQQFCYKCRKTGHTLSNCTESDNAGICYKCGSTEHMSRACTQNAGKNKFNFATCFHCSKTGHLARECPDNPKGLYPNGGSCLGCRSVDHLRIDCPKFKPKEDNEIKAERMDQDGDVEGMNFCTEEDEPELKSKKSKVKHVYF